MNPVASASNFFPHKNSYSKQPNQEVIEPEPFLHIPSFMIDNPPTCDNSDRDWSSAAGKAVADATIAHRSGYIHRLSRCKNLSNSFGKPRRLGYIAHAENLTEWKSFEAIRRAMQASLEQ